MFPQYEDAPPGSRVLWMTRVRLSLPEQPARRSNAMPPPLSQPRPFASELAEHTWESERDTRFAAFIRARLDMVAATGCAAERNIASGVREAFTRWQEKRKRAPHTDNDQFAAQASSLGWVLRCIASAAWHRAPGWEQDFGPEATPAEQSRISPDSAPAEAFRAGEGSLRQQTAGRLWRATDRISPMC
ncbi:hypothetical protein ACWD0J_10295 [Streptomyces sp. NPDC003011]